jgi:hypothetical protein
MDASNFLIEGHDLIIRIVPPILFLIAHTFTETIISRLVHYNNGNSSESVLVEGTTSFCRTNSPWPSSAEEILPVTSSIIGTSLSGQNNLKVLNDSTNFHRRSFCCQHLKPDSAADSLIHKSRKTFFLLNQS